MVYIERRFQKYTDETGSASERENILTSPYGTYDSWDTILGHDLVVIIGEAGIGKTHELKQRAEILCTQGMQAFYMPLRKIIDAEGFEFGFDTLAESEAYENWVPQNQRAYFFLDSVDEVKLQGPDEYERAIRRFRNALQKKGAQGHLQIILSCRPSDWYSRDVVLTKQWLGSILLEKNPDKQIELTSYRILPVDPDQIPVFATDAYSLPIKDEKDFIQSVENNGLIQLAGRPHDIQMMVSYWKKNNKLGGYSEMIRYGIEDQLTDTNPVHHQRSEISPNDAWDAATVLAAATVLTRNLEINTPFEGHRDDSPEVLLKNLEPKKIHQLLSRRLFDEQSPQTMRFHHRISREYLAAQWMIALIRNGCDDKIVQDWLIAEKYGQKNVIPSRTEVAAWIAHNHTGLLDEIIKIAPQILLHGGDAGLLTIQQQESVLRAYAQKYAALNYYEASPDDACLARLDGTGLSSVLKDILNASSDHLHLCCMVMDIIRVCGVAERVDDAFDLVKNPALDAEIRYHAMRAIAAAGSDHQKKALANYIMSIASLPNRMLEWAGTLLFPDFLEISDLIILLKRFEVDDRIEKGYAFAIAYDWVDNCPADRLSMLLDALVDLLHEPPLYSPETWQNDYGLSFFSQNYDWILYAVVKCVGRVLENDPVTLTPSLNKLLNSSWCAKINHIMDYDSEIRKLIEIIEKYPVIKKDYHKFCLYHVYKFREQHRILEFRNNIFDLRSEDISWLKDEIRLCGDINDVFPLARGLVLIAQSNPDFRQELRSYLATLGLPADIHDSFQQSLAEPNQTYWGIRNEMREWVSALKKQHDFWESKEYLLENIQNVRDGSAQNALHYLVNQMRASGETSSLRSRSHHNLNYIQDKFGNDIAEAFKQGLGNFWRGFIPKLPSEKEKNNSTEWGAIYGLVALSVMEESGADFSSFSPDEVALATRYALNEINDYPGWFDELIEHFPDFVRPILENEIEHVLNDPDEQNSIIRDFKYHKKVRKMVAPFLLGRLVDMDPPDGKILDDMLILLEDGVDKENWPCLFKLAEKHVRELWQSNTPKAMKWFHIWLRGDLIRAWDYLESNVDSANIPVKTLAELFLLGLDDCLGGYSRDREADKDFLKNPVFLGRALLFVYEHVPVNEDPTSSGIGMSEVTDRRRVIDIRDNLFNILRQTDGEDAHQALTDFVKHPVCASMPWLERVVTEHALRAIEPAPMSIHDVADYSKKYPQGEKTVINHIHNGSGHNMAMVGDKNTIGSESQNNTHDSKVEFSMMQDFLLKNEINQTKINELQEAINENINKPPEERMLGKVGKWISENAVSPVMQAALPALITKCMGL